MQNPSFIAIPYAILRLLPSRTVFKQYNLNEIEHTIKRYQITTCFNVYIASVFSQCVYSQVFNL